MSRHRRSALLKGGLAAGATVALLATPAVALAAAHGKPAHHLGHPGHPTQHPVSRPVGTPAPQPPELPVFPLFPIGLHAPVMPLLPLSQQDPSAPPTTTAPVTPAQPVQTDPVQGPVSPIDPITPVTPGDPGQPGQQVNPINTTVQVAVGKSARANQEMVISARVLVGRTHPHGIKAESGTVTFVIDGTASTPIAIHRGRASVRLTLPAGQHTVTARYSGDADHKPSESTTTSFTLS
jgi:hypothetical protein